MVDKKITSDSFGLSSIDRETIPVGGFQKQSLIDYPGNIASVIFTCGCNFRCNYCHNPALVLSGEVEKREKIRMTEILDWITRYKNLLDAVVITGGEPTIHNNLPDFILQIKKLGLKIKLDSNGTNYNMLKQLIDKGMVDFVAMDIKAPLSLEKYRMIVGDHLSTGMMKSIRAAVSLLMEGNTKYEFRTTLDPRLSLEDVKTIINAIKGDYFLQRLQTGCKTLKKIPGRFSEKNINMILNMNLKNVNIR